MMMKFFGFLVFDLGKKAFHFAESSLRVESVGSEVSSVLFV